MTNYPKRISIPLLEKRQLNLSALVNHRILKLAQKLAGSARGVVAFAAPEVDGMKIDFYDIRIKLRKILC